MKVLNSKLAIALVIGLLLVAVLVLALVVLGKPELIKYLIVALIVLGLLWIAIELILRARKKRKSRQFDEKLAAKEGIEDRKREWASWSAELERQGIDRYELPFYLLLGEPQSGKSILLQNSDLHFPFGQQRLSGVGGTRGCDWWFTDQAVVLDLAGRLFTHQGGASDAFEWESFLELLGDFRPLCPANGIVLVLPCDSLLEDQAEATLHKAGRMQAALVTLINKLQAQLPVYVVLTKADKVFGFAECVHRLDTPQRQQMFGWSRPSERMEAPFQSSEAQEGFQTIVGRARLLRAEMMATARLPDDSAAVQRSFAFPDELASVWANLELYLRTIFTDTALVERLFFRGMYLSSGLQTGVPIAKVCASLLTGSREADSRALETVFVKQRAYFIRDLVRERVFAERSLVRPTSARVKRAQRSARIGYGVAAAIALFAVVSSFVYVVNAPDGMLPADSEAMKAVEAFQTRQSFELLPPALEKLGNALDVESGLVATAADLREGSLQRLYGELVKRRLVTELRKQAAVRVTTALANPGDYEKFKAAFQDALLLLEAFDAGDHRELLIGGLDRTQRERFGKLFDRAAQADSNSLELLALEPASLDSEFTRMVGAAALASDLALTAGSTWQVGGDLGLVVAHDGIRVAFDNMGKAQSDGSASGPDALVKAAAEFSAAQDRLDALKTLFGAGPLSKGAADAALSAHIALRARLGKWREVGPDASSVVAGVEASMERIFADASEVALEKLVPPRAVSDRVLVASGRLAQLLQRGKPTVEEFLTKAAALRDSEAKASPVSETRRPVLVAVFKSFAQKLGRWPDVLAAAPVEPGQSNLSAHAAALGGLVRVRELIRDLEGMAASLDTSRDAVESLIGDGLTAWGDQLVQRLALADETALLDGVKAAIELQSELPKREEGDSRERIVVSLKQADAALEDALESERYDPLDIDWKDRPNLRSVSEIAQGLRDYLTNGGFSYDKQVREILAQLAADRAGADLFPRTFALLTAQQLAKLPPDADLVRRVGAVAVISGDDTKALARAFTEHDAAARKLPSGSHADRAWNVLAKRIAYEVRPKLADEFKNLESAHRTELAYLFASADEMTREGVYAEGARLCPRMLGRDGRVRALATEYGIDAYDAGVLRVDLEDDLSVAERERFEAVRFLMRLAFKLEEPAMIKPLRFEFETLSRHWRAENRVATLTARGATTQLSLEDLANPFPLEWELPKHTAIRLGWSKGAGKDPDHLIDIPGGLAPCLLWWWANAEGSNGIADLPVGAAKVQVKVAIKDKETGAVIQLPVRPRRPQ